MIKNISLDHGWYYHYRIHTLKSGNLCNKFDSLTAYLENVFKECPNDYFRGNGLRGSKLNFNLNLKIHHLDTHEVCELAKEALRIDTEKTEHTKIETFFLEKDNKTIASEVPVWIHPEELEEFSDLNLKEVMTGHIDLLRIEDGKIWVWDFKPNAANEKYASTQTYFYALMLSKRTNISLKNFRCGYFDTNNAFVFIPKIEQVL
ncbi:PD-(D/E)XK nuclease family protein [Candidatus Woesearchaeota archaeon]|nr:PD-(D/E)XK nuclease family protein [Candidatus Woesearchaeota archaeon]